MGKSLRGRRTRQEFTRVTKYSACIGTPPPFPEFGFIYHKVRRMSIQGAAGQGCCQVGLASLRPITVGIRRKSRRPRGGTSRTALPQLVGEPSRETAGGRGGSESGSSYRKTKPSQAMGRSNEPGVIFLSLVS